MRHRTHREVDSAVQIGRVGAQARLRGDGPNLARRGAGAF